MELGALHDEIKRGEEVGGESVESEGDVDRELRVGSGGGGVGDEGVGAADGDGCDEGKVVVEKGGGGERVGIALAVIL